jgi:hypothetical protein
MNYRNNRFLITVIAVILTVIFMASGCAQSTPQTPHTPFTLSPTTLPPNTTEYTPASLPSASTTSQPPLSPSASSPAVAAEPEPEKTIPTPLTSENGISSRMKADLQISKAPAVGEIVDLTYTLKALDLMFHPITRIWLQFERYDPAMYYPLGKGQYAIDRALRGLTMADSDIGNYYETLKAAKDQPESIVDEKEVVISGETLWEGPPMEIGDQVDLAARVRFPEEGEWVINAITQSNDGSTKIHGNVKLTITKDTGTIDWPKDYSSHNNIPPDEAFPVGVFVGTTRIPLLGAEMPLDITIQAIENIDQAEVMITCYRMDDYKYIKTELEKIVVEGKGNWHGSLKRGEPVQIYCKVKFPSEGDWTLRFLTRVGSEEIFKQALEFPIHIGTTESRIGWPISHRNPAIDQLIEEDKKKSSHVTPEATPGPTLELEGTTTNSSTDGVKSFGTKSLVPVDGQYNLL